MLSRIDHLIHTVYLKEILTQNAQLESLQAQINPHFLYNTLDCVNSLVDMGEKENVKKVVTSLANIMRMSIKGDTFVTVEEDLSYIKQYIFKNVLNVAVLFFNCYETWSKRYRFSLQTRCFE